MRLFLLLLLTACNEAIEKPTPEDTAVAMPDRDEDGYSIQAGDCDDSDENIGPAILEVCDGIDNNCDGKVDEGVTLSFYHDGDGDLYGDPNWVKEACTQPEEFVENANDCDDDAPDRFPENPEICDQVDNDCNGLIDDGVELLWYEDADMDGYGDRNSTAQSCSAPTGYVANADDCDDTTALASPDGAERCDELDNDCNGLVDDGVLSTYYADFDLDGYGTAALSQLACVQPPGYASSSSDCDDADETIHPDAVEICDGLDNDCDGTADEQAVDATTWYYDSDADGHGDAAITTSSCTQPGAYAADDSDCDDGNAAISPDAAESCNEVDDDCDGTIDEPDAIDAPTWYADGDADGYGDVRVTMISCSQPSAFVADATDCNDGAAAAWPGALEVCDGLDNDCDGVVDEDSAADALTWYADADADGFGDPGFSVTACSQPAGYESDALDCDDSRLDVHPTGVESCDDVDNDCDGSIDEGAVDAGDWYGDADGDGYGSPYDRQRSCDAPAGYVASFTDCNDQIVDVHPNGTELCDGYDNDCNGTVDDGVTAAATWYLDADGDGYGGSTVTTVSCTQPAGYVLNAGDCSDVDAGTYPNADETCDGRDNNCDGNIDEAAVDSRTWYSDTDGDGYGDPSAASTGCSAPAGTVSVAGDCNDSNIAVNPVAIEICDSQDNNCDGTVDEATAVGAPTWYRDADTDGYGNAASSQAACTQPNGYVASSTDCNDATSNIHPAATETCNGVDDDCDGQTDENSAANAPTWYLDSDGDGYGGSAGTPSCSQPAGYVSNSRDCNDSTTAISPAATESCNGIDDDCDGTIDENSASNTTTWYRDADADGYGSAGSTTQACTQPTGYAASATDCNDSSSAIRPGASEVCDGVDNDCDGQTDEGGTTVWYRDADGDGYGTSASTTTGCSAPTGYVASATDCNDSSSSARPGGREVCDSLDNDCDGSTDELYFSTNFAGGIDTSILSANGNAAASNGSVNLAPSAANQRGSLLYRSTIPDDSFYISFDMAQQSGSGADGLAVLFLNSSDYTSLGGGGGSQGYGGLSGWAVEFDSYQNSGYDADENHVALTVASNLSNIAYNSSIPELEDSGWHSVDVYFDAGNVQVYLDGSRVINSSIPGYNASSLTIGLSAGTGASTNDHLIDNLEVGCY